jgi:preprotein translocase subunit SecB
MEKPDAKPDFEILAQYIKDMSFETPALPKALFEKIEAAPALEVSMEVKTVRAGDSLFEVALGNRVQSRAGDRVLFVADISYAAMVAVHVADEAERMRILTKSVPAHLFPFVRALVADLTKDSGFPPVVLKAVDFDAIEMKPMRPPAAVPERAKS